MDKKLFSILLILLTCSSYAAVEVIEVDNYEDVSEIVENRTDGYTAKSTQVVFDLDDTVIRTEACPAVEGISHGFKRFEASVLNCGASLTSPLVLDLIEVLKENNYPVMAMTARRYKFGQLEGTLGQLQEKLVLSEDVEESVVVHFTTAPEYSPDLQLIPYKQPLKKGGVSDKEVAYKEGVSFVSFGNKGLALKAFNKHMKKRYKRIIFVDDQKKNINDLGTAYSGTKRSVTLIYYTEHSKKKD
ncbi:MAG: DUF2608 domain-containing protein [Bdellovibrionales bacterium]